MARAAGKDGFPHLSSLPFSAVFQKKFSCEETARREMILHDVHRFLMEDEKEIQSGCLKINDGLSHLRK